MRRRPSRKGDRLIEIARAGVVIGVRRCLEAARPEKPITNMRDRLRTLLIPIAGHEGRVLRLRLRRHLPDSDQHLAVAYQGSGVKEARNSEVLGGTPGSLIWIVDFHVRDNDRAYTAGDQNCTVGQQRCRVAKDRHGERAGKAPGSACRII